jgi:hypothetical protein
MYAIETALFEEKVSRHTAYIRRDCISDNCWMISLPKSPLALGLFNEIVILTKNLIRLEVLLKSLLRGRMYMNLPLILEESFNHL